MDNLNEFLFKLTELPYYYDLATGKKHHNIYFYFDKKGVIEYLEENVKNNYNCSYYLFYAYHELENEEKAKYHLYNFIHSFLEEDLSKTWEHLHKEDQEKKIFRVSFHHFRILFGSTHIDFYGDDVKMNILRKFMCKNPARIYHYFWQLCNRLGFKKIEDFSTINKCS